MCKSKSKTVSQLTLSFSSPEDLRHSEHLLLGVAEFAIAASLSAAADGSIVTAAAVAAGAGAAANSSYSLRAKPDCNLCQPHDDSASYCHPETG